MLEIKALTKHFGGLAAVQNFNLRISRGEIVGLIGPNGAGKTTVFNLVTGFLRPTSGRIMFADEDITARKPHTVANKGIVRTFQATCLFAEFSVLQNVIAACHLKPKVGFWEAAFHTPNSRRKEKSILSRALQIVEFVGLDNVKDIPARSLPHGHQRILGIAIALAAEPKLLLLDEPLSGMNAEEVNSAKEIVHKIWKSGITILLIEHNMGAIMSLCQRIVVLNFGNKIAEGSPEEIKENREVVQAYLGTVEYAT